MHIARHLHVRTVRASISFVGEDVMRSHDDILEAIRTMFTYVRFEDSSKILGKLNRGNRNLDLK